MAKIGGLEITLTPQQKDLLRQLVDNDATMAALETILVIEQLDWQARVVDQTQGPDPLCSASIAEIMRAGTRAACYQNLSTLLRRYIGPGP